MNIMSEDWRIWMHFKINLVAIARNMNRKQSDLIMYVRSILMVVALVIPFTVTSAVAESHVGFAAWLAHLRREALATGISRVTLDNALKDLELIPRVIELNQEQPELTLALPEYLNRTVNERRIARGRLEMARHRTLLKQVSRRYGVQPRFLVALWGIETNFGRLKGTFPVLGATATLAYRGHRRTFFRKEFLHALRIVHQGHVSAEDMKGSWAGAMGQFQWIPSSFHEFAVDYEGDGRIDIWNNLGDAFASAAHYLCQSGWVGGQTWGHRARLPLGFDRTLVGLRTRKATSQWRALGVRPIGGHNMPQRPEVLASVVQPDGSEDGAFLVYENYRAIMKWNKSQMFGIAVGALADRIMGR